MPDANDRRAPLQTTEELPIAPLATYLFDALPDLRDEFDGEIAVARLGQGYSNLTYSVKIGAREVVLRHPPIEANIATAHDMGREVKVLNGLGRVYELVPRVLHYCQDPSIIGAPFYLMERLHGTVLRAEELVDRRVADPQSTEIAPKVMAQLADNVIGNLATIHSLDYEAAQLTDLGRPAGYVARQVQGWTKRYYAAQTDALPTIERALQWLAEHQPGESGATIVHNDYKYDNLMLDSDDLTRIIGVLDWEMCTLGDPLLDLGTTLGYWIEANDPPELIEMFGLTTLPGNPNRAQVIRQYIESSGRDDFDPLFYYVYGITKIGIILQQIYHRYRQGKSQDQRFARLGGAVVACGLMAKEAIERREISALF